MPDPLSRSRRQYSRGALLFTIVSLLTQNSFPGDEYPALIAELDSIRQRNNVAAMGLVIVRDDRIVSLASRGFTDRASGEPIRDNAIFRIGSITKMFTGLAAAELEARGVLDLNQPIRDFEIDGTYHNPWQARYPVTTAQLLEHTAGLTDMIQLEWDYSNPRQPPLSETLRLYPQARTLQWQPGLHHSYSNASAGLAGYVMEQAAGQSYEQLMSELVFVPLGMKDTSVLPPPPARLPTGYDSDGITVIPYWHQIFRPFAAINTSLQDMGTFLRLFINQGQIGGRSLFAAQTIARVETPSTTLAARQGLGYGYGLGNYWWLRRGIVFHGHGGDADGYLSKMGYTRANNSGYFLVITAFQKGTLQTMQTVLEEYLIRGLEAKRKPAVHVLDAATSKQILGHYSRVSWRFPGQGAMASARTLEIFEAGGQLYSRHSGEAPQLLLPVTETLFRRRRDNRSTLFIGTGAGVTTYYQEDSDNYARLE